MTRECTHKPLPSERSRTTLRLHALMEQQQKIEIGERIRALREASPHTNASIADHVGVGERAVANWMSGGTGIQWANAKKVAELFDVDVNWLWTGREHRPGPTPDPFTSPAADAADLYALLRDLRAGQLEIANRLAVIEQLLEAERSMQSPVAQRQKAAG